MLSAQYLASTAFHDIPHSKSAFFRGVDGASRDKGTFVSPRRLDTGYNINKINGIPVMHGNPYRFGNDSKSDASVPNLLGDHSYWSHIGRHSPASSNGVDYGTAYLVMINLKFDATYMALASDPDAWNAREVVG